MLKEIMDLTDEELENAAQKTLNHLEGLTLEAKLRLTLGLMRSVIDTLLEYKAPHLDKLSMYTMLFDLTDDVKELLEEHKNEQQAPTT